MTRSRLGAGVTSALLCAALFGCGNASDGQKPAASPATPATGASTTDDQGKDKDKSGAVDLQKMYAREIDALPALPVKMGHVSGQVEASAPPKAEADEKSTRFSFSIGTSQDVECFVYPEIISVGAQLLAVVRAMKDVEIKLLRPDVVLVGDHVAVFLEAQYLANTPHGKALGELKVVAYDHPTTPMMCLHDEVGYNASFRRITTAFASSLALEGSQLIPPKFEEIRVVSVNGHPVGYQRAILLPPQKGKSKYIAVEASVIPRSDSEISVYDGARSEVLDEHGRVVEMRFAKTPGSDENADDITLALVGAKEYAVSGKHDGKPIEAKLKTKRAQGFMSELETANEIKRLLASPGQSGEVKIEEYDPAANPTGSSEAVVRVTSKKDRKATLVEDKTEIDATWDDKGRMQKGQFSQNGVTVSIERVLVKGSL